MKSQQNNFTLWSRTKQIVELTNKYNLSPVIKKDPEVQQFIEAETAHFPTKSSLSFRAIAVATENPCKCIREVCGKIIGNPNKMYCSHKCWAAHQVELEVNYTSDEIIHRIKTSSIVTPEEFDEFVKSGVGYNDDFVKVYNRVSNLDFSELSVMYGEKTAITSTTTRANRIRQLGGYLARIATYQGTDGLYERLEVVQRHQDKTENMEYFTLMYGEQRATERMKVKSDLVVGDKNPGYQHGGTLSPFSEKFVGGDIKEKTIQKAHQSRVDNNAYQSKLSYWTERYGEDEGKRLYYDRQNTFSLDKQIDKYGEVEGTTRWKQRQEMWQNTLKSLPEDKRILIHAKKGFWRFYNRFTDDMNPDDPKSSELTSLYVIRYQPRGYEREFIKVGVTNRYLTERFPSKCIKEEILIHKSDRFTNYNIERVAKRYIINNSLNILIESEDKKFDGWTECVSIEHKDKLMDIINETIRQYRKEI